jgi:hypothetical protein
MSKMYYNHLVMSILQATHGLGIVYTCCGSRATDSRESMTSSRSIKNPIYTRYVAGRELWISRIISTDNDEKHFRSIPYQFVQLTGPLLR